MQRWLMLLFSLPPTPSRHRHPITEEVLFFVEGEGECVVGKEITKVRPLTIVWVPKEVAHG